jgi:hypothetical protein
MQITRIKHISAFMHIIRRIGTQKTCGVSPNHQITHRIATKQRQCIETVLLRHLIRGSKAQQEPRESKTEDPITISEPKQAIIYQ